MNSISINNACVGCGLCAKVCPARVFEQEAPKTTPLVKLAQACVACGHCEAVCASDAVVCEPFREKGSTCAVDDSYTSQLSSLRSIRWYRKTALSTEDLNEVVQAGYNAPTAGNNRGVYISSYQTSDIDALNTIAVQHLEKMTKKAPPLVIGALKLIKAEKGKTLSAGVAKLKRIVDASKKGEYHVFHKAPHAIVISTPKSNRFGKDDADAALNYMRIAAHTMGYGTCIIGFAMLADKTVAKHITIPKDHKIHGIITLGKPSVKYSKGIKRNIV